MKKRIIAAIAMFAVFFTTSYAANAYLKTITVSYDINLSIDGQNVKLTDADGIPVKPFVYDGTTYVPIRAVSEYLGATVGYDKSTKSATVNTVETASNDTAIYLRFLTLASYASNILQTSSALMSGNVASGNFSHTDFYSTAQEPVNSAIKYGQENIGTDSPFIVPATDVIAKLDASLRAFKTLDSNYRAYASSLSYQDGTRFYNTLGRIMDLTTNIGAYVLAGAQPGLIA